MNAKPNTVHGIEYPDPLTVAHQMLLVPDPRVRMRIAETATIRADMFGEGKQFLALLAGVLSAEVDTILATHLDAETIRTRFREEASR